MYSHAMDSELIALEERIRQAAALCKQLRAENLELRQRIAQLENGNRRLEAKVADAVRRVESLLGKIPEGSP